MCGRGVPLQGESYHLRVHELRFRLRVNVAFTHSANAATCVSEGQRCVRECSSQDAVCPVEGHVRVHVDHSGDVASAHAVSPAIGWRSADRSQILHTLIH
jgi:hypothetical protein